MMSLGDAPVARKRPLVNGLFDFALSGSIVACPPLEQARAACPLTTDQREGLCITLSFSASCVVLRLMCRPRLM
jgi:hypothetical protein